MTSTGSARFSSTSRRAARVGSRVPRRPPAKRPLRRILEGHFAISSHLAATRKARSGQGRCPPADDWASNLPSRRHLPGQLAGCGTRPDGGEARRNSRRARCRERVAARVALTVEWRDADSGKRRCGMYSSDAGSISSSGGRRGREAPGRAGPSRRRSGRSRLRKGWPKRAPARRPSKGRNARRSQPPLLPPNRVDQAPARQPAPAS
jgi:hypothetical protein